MERVYIAWTTENLITVGLMAAIAYVLFAVLFQLFKNLRAGTGVWGGG